jgi:hypothetical protein
LLSVFLLLARQRFHAVFEIFRHELLDGMAVKPDELPKEADGKQVGAGFTLFLHDDLSQHRMGQILAGLGVVNEEVPLGAHHLAEILKRDVAARLRIVQAPVGVLFDDDGLGFAGTVLLLAGFFAGSRELKRLLCGLAKACRRLR